MKPKRIIACVVLGVWSGALVVAMAWRAAESGGTSIEQQLMVICGAAVMFIALVWAFCEFLD